MSSEPRAQRCAREAEQWADKGDGRCSSMSPPRRLKGLKVRRLGGLEARRLDALELGGLGTLNLTAVCPREAGGFK